MYYDSIVVVRSARRHDVQAEDIVHAVDHLLLIDRRFSTGDPPKTPVLGPDRAGNILEVIGTDDHGTLVVFHAMRARSPLLRLLDDRRRT